MICYDMGIETSNLNVQYSFESWDGGMMYGELGYNDGTFIIE